MYIKLYVGNAPLNGQNHKIGLGSVRAITLGEARDIAHTCRSLKAKGTDPKAQREEERAAARRTAQKITTFGAMSELYLKAHSRSWRNPKHRAQWASTLETYAFPVIGDMPVCDIETQHVHQPLAKISSKLFCATPFAKHAATKLSRDSLPRRCCANRNNNLGKDNAKEAKPCLNQDQYCNRKHTAGMAS